MIQGSHSGTYRATPSSVGGSYEIISRQRMAFFAVSLYALMQASVAAPNVLLLSDQLQMPRVDAASHAAQMVDLSIIRDWPNEHRVGNTMSQE